MQIEALANEYQDAHRVLDDNAEHWLAQGVRRLVMADHARWEPDPSVVGCVGLREVDGDRALLLVVWTGREDFESGWRLEEVLEGLA